MASYSYTISGNFGNGLGAGQLHSEIDSLSFSVNMVGIHIDDDDVDIEFDGVLTTGEQSTLNAAVAAHNPGSVVEVLTDVFGTEYHYVEQESVQITTSENWQEALTLDVNVPEGEYRIAWYYEWAFDATDRNFEARVMLDNTTVLGDHEQEPKESGGSSRQGSGTDQSHPVSGFRKISLNGQHSFDLDYRTEDDSDEATIYRCRFEFWRVL